MDDKTLAQVLKANEDSLRNPGKNKKPLPKEESDINPEIYLFRHGETHDNINRVFSGWRDSKLTMTGRKQAQILAEKLKNKHIDLCIISPLSRSKETAIIALKHNKEIVFEIDQRIIERNYGDLMGTSKEKATRENPEQTAIYRRGYDVPPPHGESLMMVEVRIFDFANELVDRIRRNNINVAISAHGNSMRALRKYFENLDLVEELTVENPLAQDYAQYVVRNKKYHKAKHYFTEGKLKELNLKVPNNLL